MHMHPFCSLGKCLLLQYFVVLLIPTHGLLWVILLNEFFEVRANLLSFIGGVWMADSQVFYLKMLERFQSAPASALKVCNISCHSFPNVSLITKLFSWALCEILWKYFIEIAITGSVWRGTPGSQVNICYLDRYISIFLAAFLGWTFYRNWTTVAVFEKTSTRALLSEKDRDLNLENIGKPLDLIAFWNNCNRRWYLYDTHVDARLITEKSYQNICFYTLGYFRNPLKINYFGLMIHFSVCYWEQVPKLMIIIDCEISTRQRYSIKLS